MVNDSSADRDPVEVLAEEFMERLRQGERPSIVEYKSRYPHLADDIEDIFPALAMMDEIDPSAGELSQSQPADVDVLPKLEKLGDYRIIREVGRGGMGVVYEAEQVSLGRHVALKVLPSAVLPDSKHIRRFEREAKSAAKLHHTNIVPVFGVGEQDGMHYYVMQFIQGLPLDEVIDELKKIQDQPSGTITSTKPVEKTGPFQRQQSVAEVAHSLMTGQFAETHIAESDSEVESSAAIPSSFDSAGNDSSASLVSETLNLSGSLSGSTLQLGKSGVHSAPHKQLTYWQSVANIGAQVADALQYAHEQGILHRDIKPSNLLLDLRGTTWVTDFGLAKATDQQDITHTGDILGTLRYMPPEAFDGIADARSDIYSLGLTMYELLAFQPAFGVKERHQLIKQVTTEAAPRLDKLNPQTPRDLVTIVHKAIDRDPAHRYQTAEELREDLHRFLEDEPIKARRISLTERLVRWSRRNKGLATSLATVCLLLLIINIAGPLMYLQLKESESKITEEAANNRQLAGRLQDSLDEQIETAKSLEFEKSKTQDALDEKETLANNLQQTVDDQLRDLYAGDMLQVAKEAAHGNLALMRELLLAHIPQGETDLRGPEWFYWWNFLNQAQELGQLHTSPGETAPKVHVLPSGQFVAVGRGEETQLFSRTDDGFRLADEPASTIPFAFTNTLLNPNPVVESGAIVERIGARFFSIWGFNARLQTPPEQFRIWNQSESHLQEYTIPLGVMKHLLYMAISPDGRYVAALGIASKEKDDPRCQLLVWDVATTELLVNLEHQGELSKLQFNQDGSLLAAYLDHGSQRYQDDERDVLVVYELIQHETTTEAKQLAVCSHNDDLDTVHFFPDRREMLLGTLGWSNNDRKEIYLWNIADKEPVRRLGDETLPDLPIGELSPHDGRLFALTGPRLSTIKLIDTQTGKVARTLYNNKGYKITSLTFSPEGDRLVAGGMKSGEYTVLQWQVDDPDLYALQSIPITATTNPSNPTQRVPLSPVASVSADQSLLATLDPEGLMLRSRDGESHIIGPAPDKLLIPSRHKLMFSPENRWLACYHLNQSGLAQNRLQQEVTLYKLSGRAGQKIEEKTFQLRGFGSFATGQIDMAFAGEQKLLVSRWGRVHAIDLNSEQSTDLSLPLQFEQLEPEQREPLLSPLAANHRTHQVFLAALEPEESIASEEEGPLGNDDGTERYTLHLIDAGKGDSIASQEIEHAGSVSTDIQGLVSAPDGQHVAIIWKQNRQIQLWKPGSSQTAWEFEGDGIVFSPYGPWLAVYSKDEDSTSSRIREVALWDISRSDSPQKLSTINLLGTGVDELRFTPDLRLITLHGLEPSSSADVAAEVRVWDVQSGHDLLSIPVADVNHYYWDTAFDSTADALSSLTTLSYGKKYSGRVNSVARTYDLSRMDPEEETLLVAEPLVEELFEQYLLKSEVRSQIEANDRLSNRVKAKSLLLADERPDDELTALSEFCLQLAIERKALLVPARFQLWAETIQKWFPDDPRSRLIRGIAEYYSGHHDEALSSLERLESSVEGSTAGLAPDHNLVRHAFRTLAYLDTDRWSEAEQECLELWRALRDDFGVNNFADSQIEVPNDQYSIQSLFALVRSQLSSFASKHPEVEPSPQRRAENILSVLDLNRDGALTEADAPQDWSSLQGLDRNANQSVSVEELTRLVSLANDGLDYPDEKVVRYCQTVQSYPLSSKFWGWRAYVWMQAKEYQRALESCEESLRLDPTSEEEVYCLYVQGRVFYALHDYDEAIAQFKQVNKLDPNHAQAWRYRGACYIMQGKVHEALPFYDRAIELLPNDFSVRNSRGRHYLAIGDFIRARDDFDKCVQLSPKSSFYFGLRGDAKFELEDYPGAIKDYTKALQLAPARLYLNDKLSLVCVMNGDPEQAAQYMLVAIESETDVGKRMQRLQRISELNLDFTKLAEQQTDDALLRLVLSRQQSEQEARDTLTRALQSARQQFDSTPDDESSTRDLSTVLLAAKESSLAWEILSPEKMESAGGAKLAPLDDGSILASGTNPVHETYTIVARPKRQTISNLRLETMPHLSLPFGSTGRDPRLGNFLISEVRLAIRDQTTGMIRKKIEISGVFSEAPVKTDGTSADIRNLIDSDPEKHWTAWPELYIPHCVVFELEEAITLSEDESLQVTIDSRDPNYTYHAPGRFRVSVSSSPTALERERLAVQTIEDAWEQLAAVYHHIDDESKRDALLENRPMAVFGLFKMCLQLGDFDRASTWLDRAAAIIPNDTDSQLRLAQGYMDLAGRLKHESQQTREFYLVQDVDHPAETIEAYTKAIEILKQELQKDPIYIASARSQLGTALRGRAMAFACLGIIEKSKSTEWHALAVADWNEFIQIYGENGYLFLKALQATSRIHYEPIKDVLADVETLDREVRYLKNYNCLYNLACVYALASERSPENKEAYAARAMQLLRRSVAIKTRDPYTLRAQVYLKPLQHRDDFRQLLEEVESRSSN